MHEQGQKTHLSVHKSDDLVHIFNHCFSGKFKTRLVGGGDEPIYLPADSLCDHHRIIFTRDYFASALHEVAHWCIAGEQRRQRVDYGYWYAPDGRTASQQSAFEQVEVRPQALEWLFSRAAGYRFRISADNVEQGLSASDAFTRAVTSQVRHYCETGLAPRPQQFLQALIHYYKTDDALDKDTFRAEAL